MHPARQNLTVAMPWYEQEDFFELWTLAHDRDEMPARYEEWREEATRVLNEMLASGRAIQIVAVRPGPYVAWLSERNLPNTSQTRLRYVEELATSGKAPERKLACHDHGTFDAINRLRRLPE